MFRYICLTIFVLFISLSFISNGAIDLGVTFILLYTLISIIMFGIRHLTDKITGKRIGRMEYYAEEEYSKLSSESTVNYCSQCGAKIETNCVFCSQCGNKLK